MATLRARRDRPPRPRAPLGLWRDAAPIPDMFGFMSHEMCRTCLPYQLSAGAGHVGVEPAREHKRRPQRGADRDVIVWRVGADRRQVLFPLPETGLERRLWRITAPTLIIWGADDRFVAPVYAEIFREKIRERSS